MSCAWVTAPALATRLGVSRWTVNNWTAEGRFPKAAIQWFGRVPRYSLPLLQKAGWLTPDPVEAKS
jgi:hypothetical protein